MSSKQMKLLRKGAKKYNLPYESLKKAYKNLNSISRKTFSEQARRATK